MSRSRSALAQIAPRLVAIGAVAAVWLIVSATGFFDQTLLPSPSAVGHSLAVHFSDGTIPTALGRSLIRLAVGFGFSIVLGSLLGLAMTGSRFVERSLGSLILGLQSLPSISWLPLAILWFGLNERAIEFVVIIGAFPAVALATQTGLRQVPPLLQRAGRTLGARGWRLYRSVIFPAAIPTYIGGLQQGWAFAWRALMAGELIATGALGLGHLLDEARQRIDTAEVLAVMVVIIVVGMAVDLLIFGAIDRRVRARRGLLTQS